ncbi:glycoside hydrolase family 37 [Paenibacillus hemerocallicola]|uniref:Glycoside hydrolase family 37 n=1 Tax=Paenibacillus hemerocallicola TaxID=1172614 RepID=A0A5C4SXV7_9BACL|nr:trehalase family glycosidase [Paenibacillus hemerocallicola]TNJ60823.1 glycoside hydrolase family 37 [Paenibacillus hemerocallicola]
MQFDHYIKLLREHTAANYKGMYREAGGAFPHPFLTPGSLQYADILWDWDSWLSNVALRQILLDQADPEASEAAMPYERGSILNFLSLCDKDGWIPIVVQRADQVGALRPADIYSSNMHKPVLAQHAAFLVSLAEGDAEWLRESLYPLQRFVNNYRNHHRHEETGLYYWQNDHAIGVDNDPCTYFRPAKSSASIYLNCLMYKELLATGYLCECLQLPESAADYRRDAERLKQAIIEHCWDERDGFYYSADILLQPKSRVHGIHSGQPRDWSSLIQRIGVWTGFMSLWSGVAEPEQAERIVAENLHDMRTFWSPYGVRTLSGMEKMYSARATRNPSNWLGPIWGISNYMTFRGLVDYGFENDAKELAEKTVLLFGRDIERFGGLHEYYQPDNGEPMLNKGFQNWNYLVMQMIAWLEGQPVIKEF